MAAEPPAKPRKEIPDILKEDVEKLHRSVQVLLVAKQIPWIVQAQMARDGYTTLEDLACRWTTADLARTQSPTDLKFKDGENGFDQQGSNFTAMRIYQAVLQAKHMFQSGPTSGAAAPGSVGVSRSNLDALCDRIAMEKDWISQTGSPKPRLEYQGSDAFLKKQFKYCAKGEIGYFAPKHIVSALPEEGERPTKSHRRFTVDGFEKEEEEEERPNPQTRRQLERMHTVFRNNLLMCLLAFPQFQQFDVCKSDLDDWYDWFYGPEIAGRKPPPSETTLLWAERNAWRQICQLMADGATLKNSLKQMKENQLFWTREVYERIMFQQLRSPREPKGKGKGKGKGKTKSVKGVHQDHLKPSPSGQKGGGKFEKGQSKGGRPGQLTGRSNPRRESPTAGTSISSILAKAIATDHMHAQSRSTGGPAMGITPQTSAPTEENLEPSRDLALTAHRDRRAGRGVLRMKSQTRLRQTGSQGLHRPLFLQRSLSFPKKNHIILLRGRRQR